MVYIVKLNKRDLLPIGGNDPQKPGTTTTPAATPTPTPATTSHAASTPAAPSPQPKPSSASHATTSSKAAAQPSSTKEAAPSSTSSVVEKSSVPPSSSSSTVTSSSSSSSSSTTSSATSVILTGSQTAASSFAPGAEAFTTSGTYTGWSLPTDDGTSSGLASAARTGSSNGFFANKGAVAGTFTVVALIALGVIAYLVTWAQRKRRQAARRKDRYLKSGWVSDRESQYRKSGEEENKNDDGYDFDSSRYNHQNEEHEGAHEEVVETTGDVPMSTFNSPSMVAFSNNMDHHGAYVEPTREAASPQIHHQYTHSVTHDYLGQGQSGNFDNGYNNEYRMSGLEFPPEGLNTQAQTDMQYQPQAHQPQQQQSQQQYSIYNAPAQPVGRQYKSSPLAHAYSGEQEHHAIGEDEDTAHAV